MDADNKKLLTDIHSAVLGNEALGHEGLVKKVDRHERWISNATLKVAGIVGGATVLLFIAKLVFKLP